MKKFKALSAFFVLFTALSFVSCDTEPVDSELIGNPVNGNPNNPNPTNPNNPANPTNPATGVFKVDYDGATHVATMAQAIVNEEYINITGMMPDGGTFIISVPQPAVGTYVNLPSAPVDIETVLGMAYLPSGGTNTYLGVSDDYGDFGDNPAYVDNAQVIITSIDMVNETITGTFQFNGVRYVDPATGFEIETKEFTNGSFSLSFDEDVVTPSDNEFFAKLDGEDFIPTTIQGYVSMGNIAIVGRRGPIENIGFFVPEDVVPGTYELSSFTGDYRALYILNDSPTGIFGAEDGTVTITSNANGRLAGTFTFTASMFGQTAIYEITEGTFDVAY